MTNQDILTKAIQKAIAGDGSDYAVNEILEAIYTLVEGVIGEDEPVPTLVVGAYNKNNIIAINARNLLRAEQRSRLEKLL